MTHVSMLPAKALFIMLPWGHTEMMICFSNINLGMALSASVAIWPLAVANLSNFLLCGRPKSVYG